MSESYNVTASFDKSSYNQGDLMTVAISGDAVITSNVTSNSQVGPLNLTLAANGATNQVITVPAIFVPVTTEVTSNASVTIIGVIDSSPTPRTWTIANNQLSVSAQA